MNKDNYDKNDNSSCMCLDHEGKLGLTEKQLHKLTPLHRDMQKMQIQSRANQRIAEIELCEIMEEKNFNLEKANAAVKKIEKIKTAHHVELLKPIHEMRSVLTEEQFQKSQKCHFMGCDEHSGLLLNQKHHGHKHHHLHDHDVPYVERHATFPV